MISGLTSTGAHTTISGGSPGTLYIDNNRPLAGTVKYDGTLQSLMVFDGSVWTQMPRSYASVGLTSIAESAIQWAINKMNSEAEYTKLAAEHPAVHAALENLEKAKQQLDVTIILSKEHEQPTN